MTRKSPPPVPDSNGSPARLFTGGQIVPSVWLAIAREGGSVGACRSTNKSCNGELIPDRPMRSNYRGMERIDYMATCDRCGKEVVFPFGKAQKMKWKPVVDTSAEFTVQSLFGDA